MSFFEGIEQAGSYGGGRAPKLGLGKYKVKVAGTSLRESQKDGTEFVEIVLSVLESDNPAHPVGSEGCIQIWPRVSHKKKYHLAEIRAFVLAAMPTADVTEKFCNAIIAEDLLFDAVLSVSIQNNAKGYPTPNYSAA